MQRNSSRLYYLIIAAAASVCFVFLLPPLPPFGPILLSCFGKRSRSRIAATLCMWTDVGTLISEYRLL